MAWKSFTATLTAATAGLALSAALAWADEGDCRSPGGRPPGPPPEALEACAEVGEGASCTFLGREDEEVVGTCELRDDVLACVPEGVPPPRRRAPRDAQG